MRMFADVSWTGADSGDIASGGNWEGNSVPVFNESTSTGEAAVFYGKGECTVPLTMGSSLYINSFLFISDTSARYGTTWDMDLAEKTLRLYGDYDFHGDHALYVFGYNQKIFFRNGILDFAGAYPNTIMMVMVQGSGSELVF